MMAAAELTTQETELERIERWRAGELKRAGYEATAASLLAARADVDLLMDLVIEPASQRLRPGARAPDSPLARSV